MEQASPSFAPWAYGATAVAFLIFAVQLSLAWRGNLRGSLVLLAALLSAAWAAASCAAAAWSSPQLLAAAGVFDALRVGAWIGLLLAVLHLPDAAVQPRQLARTLRRPLVALLATVLAVHVIVLLGLSVGVIEQPAGRRLFFATALALSVAALAAVEQLVRNIPVHARWGVKPMSVALTCAFAFDLYMYADAFLFRALDADIWAVRGIVNAIAIPFVAISAARNRDWTLEISVSRQVMFHSTALVVSGIYLLAISAAGYYVRYFGGSWGKAMQAVLLFAGLLAFGMIAFSGSARAKLKVWLSKHFFSYRYDYREEWLKFTRALSMPDAHLHFQQLTIKALADLVESPAGGLWLRAADGRYVQAARWNMPESQAAEAPGSAFVRLLADANWVVNLEEAVAKPEIYGEGLVPSWLTEYPSAWLVVPLLCGEDLIGFIVLARSRVRVEVNWEVLDLLKTAGRQAASYLGQVLVAEALLEARKFDSFNRMSAFVVHDVKNLVAQLSLLLTNAERHKDNPEFQQDMLDTVRHVVERMKGLLLQLRSGTQPVDRPKPVELREILLKVHSSKMQQAPSVTITAEGGLFALCHPDRMERVIGHLVQNAMDATAADGRVWIRLEREGEEAVIEVGDTGHGMSREFIQERLFKPFQSTKQSGMGIGAYESHQYITELGGRMTVESQLHHGTRMRVVLPVCASASIQQREAA